MAMRMMIALVVIERGPCLNNVTLGTVVLLRLK